MLNDPKMLTRRKTNQPTKTLYYVQINMFWFTVSLQIIFNIYV